jgi:hypothetical protein
MKGRNRQASLANSSMLPEASSEMFPQTKIAP